MIDYSKIIELDNVTMGDCIDGCNYCGRRVIINDGHIVGFVDEEE